MPIKTDEEGRALVKPGTHPGSREGYDPDAKGELVEEAPRSRRQQIDEVVGKAFAEYSPETMGESPRDPAPLDASSPNDMAMILSHFGISEMESELRDLEKEKPTLVESLVSALQFASDQLVEKGLKTPFETAKGIMRNWAGGDKPTLGPTPDNPGWTRN